MLHTPHTEYCGVICKDITSFFIHFAEDRLALFEQKKLSTRLTKTNQKLEVRLGLYALVFVYLRAICTINDMIQDDTIIVLEFTW